MHVTQEHRLARTRQCSSPNQDHRPDPRDISLLVIHNISLPPGQFGSGLVEKFFLNQLDTGLDPELADLAGVKVSAHLLIDRRGRTIQFVPFDQRAWHAGVSEWRGRSGCNDFAIGIELEGTDYLSYTQAQYRRLELVIRALLAAYPRLSRSAIVGHQEIAPDRKTDPGPVFDWSRVLRGSLAAPE